jgi:hypothetical protein
MNSKPDRFGCRRPFIVLAVLLLVGCAALPPAVPATDLKSLVGRWEGTYYTAGGNQLPFTVTIGDDGRYDARTPSGSRQGTLQVIDGKIMGKSAQTGNTFTWSLHQEGSKLTLAGGGAERGASFRAAKVQ